MVLDDFLDKLSDRERNGLVAAFAVAVLVSLAAGFAGASVAGASPVDLGESASEGEIRDVAQNLMDQQVSQQEQQLALLAAQDENLSEEDMHINATVEDVSQSEFPSLYRVTANVEGEIPNQQTGEIEPMEQEQVLYISKDGQYLFPQPTDLEEMQQQQQEQ